MQLSDCEITHRHMRGHNVAFVFGERALSAAEAAALGDEYLKAYGPVGMPAYVSPDGWQLLGTHQVGPLASRFSFDEAADVVICDGNKFSGALFDSLNEETRPGYWLRVISVEGGVVTMQQRSEDYIRGAAPASPASAPDADPVPAADQVPASTDDQSAAPAKRKYTKAKA